MSASTRIQSIDFLRGFVMIIMAFDHCREFLHLGATMDQNPLDLDTTTPALFATRWITHFCAPVFVMLSGTSIFLYGSKGKSKNQITYFLFTRGLWLMLVEIFIVEPMWDFSVSIIYLQVIWAVGLSMVILSVLQFLPLRVLASLGMLIVLGHNLLDGVVVTGPLWQQIVWWIVHQKSIYQASDHLLLVITYPFLPWLSIMILGYCMGVLYQSHVIPDHRKRVLRVIGVLAIGLFVLLRFSNMYGDPHRWVSQDTALYTFLDFINVTKYPPSLLYTLITLGPALIMLSLTEGVVSSLYDKVVAFGKVPFFYYLIHVLLIHVIAFLVFFVSGHSWSDLDFTHFRPGSLPYGSGHALWLVYVVWLSVILILYYPCFWYSRYKERNKSWWLSYL